MWEGTHWCLCGDLCICTVTPHSVTRQETPVPCFLGAGIYGRFRRETTQSHHTSYTSNKLTKNRQIKQEMSLYHFKQEVMEEQNIQWTQFNPTLQLSNNIFASQLSLSQNCGKRIWCLGELIWETSWNKLSWKIIRICNEWVAAERGGDDVKNKQIGKRKKIKLLLEDEQQVEPRRKIVLRRNIFST